MPQNDDHHQSGVVFEKRSPQERCRWPLFHQLAWLPRFVWAYANHMAGASLALEIGAGIDAIQPFLWIRLCVSISGYLRILRPMMPARW